MHRTARAFTGLCLGVVFAFLFEVLPPNIFHDRAADFYGIFGILNAPADWLAHFWSYPLQLPPRGEIEYVLVQDVTKGLQWAFIGLLVGIWWGFACPHSRSSARNGGGSTTSGPTPPDR